MNHAELLRLADLLVKFVEIEGHDGSLNGREMDRALADDLLVALSAYGNLDEGASDGLDYNTYLDQLASAQKRAHEVTG